MYVIGLSAGDTRSWMDGRVSKQANVLTHGLKEMFYLSYICVYFFVKNVRYFQFVFGQFADQVFSCQKV